MASSLRPETLAIHTGVYKDTAFNSVTTPIYPCSTFYFNKLGESKGYEYGRFGNPTRRALEENLAALEGGADALATATGMAALSTSMLLMCAGYHVIAGNDITAAPSPQLLPPVSARGLVHYMNDGPRSAPRSAKNQGQRHRDAINPAQPVRSCDGLRDRQVLGLRPSSTTRS